MSLVKKVRLGFLIIAGCFFILIRSPRAHRRLSIDGSLLVCYDFFASNLIILISAVLTWIRHPAIWLRPKRGNTSEKTEGEE